MGTFIDSGPPAGNTIERRLPRDPEAVAMPGSALTRSTVTGVSALAPCGRATVISPGGAPAIRTSSVSVKEALPNRSILRLSQMVSAVPLLGRAWEPKWKVTGEKGNSTSAPSSPSR